MKIKSKLLHVFWLGDIAIFSALLSFSCTVILLIWYIKQPKLNANCSKMLRAASPCHMVCVLC
jgi:energy-converting hydrogenase Eha subunit C